MPSADYVVVGAGSAGCVVAARLSEDPDVTVTLLEAGGAGTSLHVRIPAGFPRQFKTGLDWDYSTEPEPHCDGRELYIPRGRSLGGSSSMNAQIYVRGRPLDYDLWEARGATGWGWEQVRPYFLRSEDNARGTSEHHATGGPLRVEDLRSPTPLSEAFLEAMAARGVARIDDCNGPEQDGALLTQVTQRRGRRWSAADAYVRPVQGKRANLSVALRERVERIELAGGRAVAVHAGGQRFEARREVILCAGAIGSPQLLLLSGVGPADHLHEVGVEVRHELAGVGENLQDHPYVVGIWETGQRTLDHADGVGELVRWLATRRGPATSSIAEAYAFLRTRPGLPAADVQMYFVPAYFRDNGFARIEGRAFSVGPCLLTPRSRGRVRLRSASPLDKPRILTNTLADPEDLAVLVDGLVQARAIAGTEPLASAALRELEPGPAVADRAELEDYVRRNVELLYHPVGTCRMGVDADAVVDPQLRVRGIAGLRVADASVMPVIPGGNTNAPSIMIGERAADLIKQG